MKKTIYFIEELKGHKNYWWTGVSSKNKGNRKCEECYQKIPKNAVDIHFKNGKDSEIFCLECFKKVIERETKKGRLNCKEVTLKQMKLLILEKQI